MNLNKVFLLGRVTANPEIRKTPGGQSVTSFTVATNRVWTAKNGSKQQSTEFHNVVVWGRQAEIATQFLTKGSLVLIEGRLQTRSWQNKAGETKYTTEIICERIQLGPKPMGSKPEPSSFENFSQNNQSDIKDDVPEIEIPTIDIEEETKPEDLPF
jgi:single-strand DNA-binding protein